MDRWDLQTLWRKLEDLLDEALEIEHARIGQKQAQIVKEYIDHNEFGLAYDQLVDALANLELKPMERSTFVLNEANRLMELPP